MELEKEVKRQREIAKNSIYPILLESSENVGDAQLFMQSMGVQIRSMFMDTMKRTLLKDLHLKDKLDPASPKYEKYLNLIELLSEENISVALGLVEGMSDEIQANIVLAIKQKPLSELPTNFFE